MNGTPDERESAAVEAMCMFDGPGGDEEDEDGAEAALVSMAAGENAAGVVRAPLDLEAYPSPAHGPAALRLGDSGRRPRGRLVSGLGSDGSSGCSPIA